MTYLLVMLGGGCGAVARFLLDNTYQLLAGAKAKPGRGIALVNILACFLIGLAGAKLASQVLLYQTLVGGFLGGFSTYSTHLYDSYNLWQQQQYWESLKLLLGTYLLSVLAVWAGYALF